MKRDQSDEVRIACVGDSITAGTFVWLPKTNAYPAQLQAMLGERSCVRNFGVNGHAVQQAADLPYRRSKAFARSCAFEPDIVLLLLGTNDSRGSNWRGIRPFEDDYRTLVEHYLSLGSNPEVWLMTPPTLYRLGRSPRVRYAMNESAIAEICDVIRACAGELECGLIDINRVTAGHPEAFRFDGVHPGGAGATLIARAVYDTLHRRDPELG